MDNNRIWAEKLWDGIDRFWELLENSNVFTTIWQTMYAYSEYAYWLMDSYDSLGLPLMPSERVIASVIWEPDDGIIGQLNTEDEDFDYSAFISIPILKPTISYDDTEYVEGVDYTVTGGDGKSIQLDWGEAEVPDVTSFYAPKVIVSNDDKIELYSNTGVWDLDLSDYDIEDKKHICYALRKYKHATPDKEMLYRVANMLAGAPYAKYPGKVSISGDTLTVNHVSSLYVVKYNNIHYGSETREGASITITGGIGASSDTILAGDIVILDDDNTVQCAVVSGDDIYFAETVDDGEYAEAVVFRPININLMECYAINGDTKYSCYTDTVPNDVVCEVTHALNYDIDNGYAEQSAIYDMTDLTPCVADGDYVDMHQPLVEKGYFVGWREIAENNMNPNIPTCDDIISNYYMPGSGVTYYRDWEDYGEIIDELSVGDILIAYVTYTMYCGIAPAVELHSKTVSLPMPTELLDMYGNAVSGASLNFQMGERILLQLDGFPENEEEAFIKDGYYDALTDSIILETTQEIENWGVDLRIYKMVTAKHRHVITDIDIAEITTDRTAVFGEYSNNCMVTFKRSKDQPNRATQYTCDHAVIGMYGGTIYLTEEPGEQTMGAFGANKIAVYGPLFNTAYYDVTVITGNELYTPTMFLPSAEKWAGAHIIFLNNLYDRNEVLLYLDADAYSDITKITNIQTIASTLLPAGITMNLAQIAP
jgi:hypothetical protein